MLAELLGPLKDKLEILQGIGDPCAFQKGFITLSPS